MNHQIFIRQQLYVLKRQYGGPLDIYIVTTGPTNLETGAKVVNKTKYHIALSPIIPISLTQNSIFSAAYMKNVGREFAYGNFIDLELKRVIIDQRDLPIGFDPDIIAYIVIDHKRYEIMKNQKLGNNIGYQIDIKRAVGVPTNEIFDLTVSQKLRVIERQVCQ